jgi:hypothetical protein
MADERQQEPRPLWVRCVAREGTMRNAARTQVRIYLVLAICGLLVACSALLRAALPVEGGAFLIENRLPLGLAGACLGAAGAIWCWLAIRWVDRNGKWA